MIGSLLAFIVSSSFIWDVNAAQTAFSSPFQAGGGGNVLISDETDSYIDSLMTRYNSSGLSVAVVRKDEAEPSGWATEYRSYGIATGDGQPTTADTLFAIASNSKLFLSLSVGLLIKNESLAQERGVPLKWTSKAKDVFAGTDLWGMMDEEMTMGINLQDMLSHRTGLPRHDFSGVSREGGIAEMISKLRYLRPSAEFRQQFQYNNLMYETLSYLPTLFFNQSYDSYITENLFRPLNMTSSTYSVAEAESWGTLANGFMYHMEDQTLGHNGSLTATVPYFLRPGREMIWAGAGGVLTSTRDLVKWLSMLMSDGQHPTTNETVVSRDIIDHVATGLSVSDGKADYPEMGPKVYGCGQWRYTYHGHEVIDHGGHNPGFHTQVARFPHDNLGIIVLSNDEHAYRFIDVVRWRIADEILGLPKIDWEDRYLVKRAAETLAKRQKYTPTPANPNKPSTPFENMTGSFLHPTYGSFNPCFVQSTSTATTNDECWKLSHHPVVAKALNATASSVEESIALIAPFPKFFASYVIMRHFDGNLFNASIVWSNWDERQREGYSSNLEGSLITGLDDRFEVEWVETETETGFAFRGNFWGAAGEAVTGIDGEMEGAKGKDGAEVWFGQNKIVQA